MNNIIQVKLCYIHFVVLITLYMHYHTYFAPPTLNPGSASDSYDRLEKAYTKTHHRWPLVVPICSGRWSEVKTKLGKTSTWKGNHSSNTMRSGTHLFYIAL